MAIAAACLACAPADDPPAASEADRASVIDHPKSNGALINDVAMRVLEEFNPKFQVRKAEDYSPTIQADAIENGRQPFMVRIDANRDGVEDLILDGHDDQREILLALLSRSDGYDVVVIRESTPALVPEEIESWNDGVKETGLNYFMWPHGTGTGFTLAAPQQSDPDGVLLRDGFMIENTFRDGVFVQQFQVP